MMMTLLLLKSLVVASLLGGVLLPRGHFLVFGSTSINDGGSKNDDRDNNNNNNSTTTTVNISYECLKDVEKLYYKMSGFYECEVEWNVKVSFDMTLKLEEYCHHNNNNNNNNGGVSATDTTAAHDDDDYDDDYDEGGGGVTTDDDDNGNRTMPPPPPPPPPPPDCFVEYNRLECYFDFWDKCHIAGGRTITQDVNYDCFDNGLQLFTLTLIGKVDCVPDSCLTHNKDLFPNKNLARAFATISNCKILSTNNIKVDEIDHDAKPNNNNNHNYYNPIIGTLQQNDGSNSINDNDNDHDHHQQQQHEEAIKGGNNNNGNNDFDDMKIPNNDNNNNNNNEKSKSNNNNIIDDGIYIDYRSILFVIAIAVLVVITIIFCAYTNRCAARTNDNDGTESTNIEDEERNPPITTTLQEDQALHQPGGVSYGSCD